MISRTLSGIVWPTIAISRCSVSSGVLDWRRPAICEIGKALPPGQDIKGRLWDVLWMLRCAVKSGTQVNFSVLVSRKRVHLKSISGPGDITVTNIQSITATDKTPGVSFTAAVAANAALGARTVLLRDLKDDITSFTCGFEVQ